MGIWDSYREGSKMTLEQALEIAKNPELYTDRAAKVALAVLGYYVHELVDTTKKELEDGV